jgi:hypothetical protein
MKGQPDASTGSMPRAFKAIKRKKANCKPAENGRTRPRALVTASLPEAARAIKKSAR